MKNEYFVCIELTYLEDLTFLKKLIILKGHYKNPKSVWGCFILLEYNYALQGFF